MEQLVSIVFLVMAAILIIKLAGYVLEIIALAIVCIVTGIVYL